MCNVWEHNADDIIHKINRMINALAKTNIARKITLVLSLMLAKLTHLFLALPNPSGELIKILDKTFYKLSVAQWSGQSK